MSNYLNHLVARSFIPDRDSFSTDDSTEDTIPLVQPLLLSRFEPLPESAGLVGGMDFYGEQQETSAEETQLKPEWKTQTSTVPGNEQPLEWRSQSVPEEISAVSFQQSPDLNPEQLPTPFSADTSQQLNKLRLSQASQEISSVILDQQESPSQPSVTQLQPQPVVIQAVSDPKSPIVATAFQTEAIQTKPTDAGNQKRETINQTWNENVLLTPDGQQLIPAIEILSNIPQNPVTEQTQPAPEVSVHLLSQKVGEVGGEQVLGKKELLLNHSFTSPASQIAIVPTAFQTEAIQTKPTDAGEQKRETINQTTDENLLLTPDRQQLIPATETLSNIPQNPVTEQTQPAPEVSVHLLSQKVGEVGGEQVLGKKELLLNHSFTSPASQIAIVPTAFQTEAIQTKPTDAGEQKRETINQTTDENLLLTPDRQQLIPATETLSNIPQNPVTEQTQPAPEVSVHLLSQKVGEVGGEQVLGKKELLLNHSFTSPASQIAIVPTAFQTEAIQTKPTDAGEQKRETINQTTNENLLLTPDRQQLYQPRAQIALLNPSVEAQGISALQRMSLISLNTQSRQGVGMTPDRQQLTTAIETETNLHLTNPIAEKQKQPAPELSEIQPVIVNRVVSSTPQSSVVPALEPSFIQISDRTKSTPSTSPKESTVAAIPSLTPTIQSSTTKVAKQLQESFSSSLKPNSPRLDAHTTHELAEIVQPLSSKIKPKIDETEQDSLYRGNLTPQRVGKEVLPEQRESSETSATPPNITVSIGRIEIRATQPPAQPRPKSRSTPSVMSLDEYLRRRSRGGMR